MLVKIANREDPDVFSIRVENSVDPEQMTLLEAS